MGGTLAAGAEVTCERCGSVGVLEGEQGAWTIRWVERSARAKAPQCIVDRWEREHWDRDFAIVGLDGKTIDDAGTRGRVALVRSLPT